jgi:outer membrane biosynthesis protein TonB
VRRPSTKVTPPKEPAKVEPTTKVEEPAKVEPTAPKVEEPAKVETTPEPPVAPKVEPAPARVVRQVEAGPIGGDASAKKKCPTVCAPGKWTGGWRTTIKGKMSTCDCEQP